MKIINCEQGSPEWFAARLAVPTASCFDKLLTPTGQPSKQVDAYANQLIAEWLCGEPVDGYENEWMIRGRELEAKAAQFYAMETGADLESVGFIKTDDDRAGCSPDRLVGADGMVEIKCPAPHTHVGYLLDGKAPGKYRPQLQGQLFVAEREWVDFLSFHPQMPPLLIREYRDEAYIKKLDKQIDALLLLTYERQGQLRKRGILPVQEAA